VTETERVEKLKPFLKLSDRLNSSMATADIGEKSSDFRPACMPQFTKGGDSAE